MFICDEEAITSSPRQLVGGARIGKNLRKQ